MNGFMRTDIINCLIKKKNYKSYLEVGTQRPESNFFKIYCEHKECIDPVPLNDIITYKMTSDEAFQIIHKLGKRYDIIFIDGMHTKEQVDKDIQNSLMCLNDGGIIVLHDCNPPTKLHAMITYDDFYANPSLNGGELNGTVYQSIIRLRIKRSDLFVCVVDTDWGCGIVQKGYQELHKYTYEHELYEYDYFAAHRKELLNLISVSEFCQLYDLDNVSFNKQISQKIAVVLGANGMLGRYVTSYLKSKSEFVVFAVTRKQLDASNFEYDKVIEMLSTFQNAYVINCVGKIPQRGDNGMRSYIQINTLFPHLMSQCCMQTGNHFIHITTDCVFTGSKGDYKENDAHDETNIYGLSKSLGEPYNATVIRTSIIGEELENKKSLLEWVRANCGKTVSGYVNHYWNGVTCLQLAKILGELIISGQTWKGVRHIYSDTVNKYELVKMIADVYGLDMTILPIQTEVTVNKTLATIYEVIAVPGLREQVVEMRDYKLG